MRFFVLGAFEELGLPEEPDFVKELGLLGERAAGCPRRRAGVAANPKTLDATAEKTRIRPQNRRPLKSSGRRPPRENRDFAMRRAHDFHSVAVRRIVAGANSSSWVRAWRRQSWSTTSDEQAVERLDDPEIRPLDAQAVRRTIVARNSGRRPSAQTPRPPTGSSSYCCRNIRYGAYTGPDTLTPAARRYSRESAPCRRPADT